jgi:hypothetical protein
VGSSDFYSVRYKQLRLLRGKFGHVCIVAAKMLSEPGLEATFARRVKDSKLYRPNLQHQGPNNASEICTLCMAF